MSQDEKLDFLIGALFHESPRYRDTEIPPGVEEKKMLLRSLFNVRPPTPASEEFLKIQDEYLSEEIRARGITDIDDLKPVRDNLYLWRGDITTLKAGAIVNAANNQMLGCFIPCHGCIDNAIHTYAGVQLRLACNDFMQAQGKPEETGTAKITPAFNLPSDYVLHTVGPIIKNRSEGVFHTVSAIVEGKLTRANCEQLASCYRSCLALAERNNITSVAFCCISTGEYHFPNDKAAEIAMQTVNKYIAEKQSKIKVIFNVFKETDYEIYKQLLTAN